MSMPAQRSPWGNVLPVRPSSVTVIDYLDTWLATKASLRPSSLTSYRNHADRFLNPTIGTVGLQRLGVDDVEHSYRRILSGEFGDVSVATVHLIHATLMSALNAAVRRGLIPTNPAALVELPRKPRRDMTTWTSRQAQRFLEGASGHDWYLVYRLLLVCGLRRGEALGLQLRDVTAPGAGLLIRRQVTKVGAQLLTGEPKSARGVRTVQLDQHTTALLAAHLRDDPGPQSPTGWVFHDQQGDPLDPALVSRRFTTLVKQLGLPGIRLHDLRHTSASLGLEAGEPITQVSRRLGHSTIAITCDIYTHVSTEAARQAVESLMSILATARED